MQIKTQLSPVAEAVDIVREMTMGMSPSAYPAKVERLHKLMARHAIAEIRPAYEPHLREADPDYVLTAEDVTSDQNEDTPMAHAYWAATSAFFRKVHQALAASA